MGRRREKGREREGEKEGVILIAHPHSQVDVLNPDLDKYPRFGEIETCFEDVIGPGDGVFIPRGMWHHVSSLSTSISISFWWG